MNIVLLGFLYIAGSLGLSLLGLMVVRRKVSAEKLRPHHDVAGFLIAIIGVIYAVLLAFVVIVAWEQFDRAEAHASQEADAVLAAYRLAHALPTPGQAAVRADLRGYAASVIHDDWPAMAEGRASDRTQTILDVTWEHVIARPPSSPGGVALYQSLVDRLNDITTYRLLRLVDSRQGVPALMWATLYFGAAAVMVFTYFFALENKALQVLMTALLSVMIGLTLFLISAIDHPFTGDLRVRPETMAAVQERMDRIDADERVAHPGDPIPGPPAP